MGNAGCWIGFLSGMDNAGGQRSAVFIRTLGLSEYFFGGFQAEGQEQDRAGEKQSGLVAIRRLDG